MATLGSIPLPTEAELGRRDRGRLSASRRRLALLVLLGLGTSLGILGLIGLIVVKGLPAINWEFLSSPPVEGMTAGGIWPMLRGSLLLMLGTLAFVLPVGILSGVFLAEYAGHSRFANLIRSCNLALAGTPSIIYGLFGLAVFVLLLKMGTSLLAGWLTVSLFALPMVVLTTDNSIRQVPGSMADAGLALGLSRWQTIWKIVLPNALPGILSGVVLMTGRAAGEAPPILFTAGIYYSTAKLTYDVDMIHKPVANLPYHLAEGYRQGGVIPEKIIWGTCLTLMLMVLLINLGAILVRSRMRWKQAS
ncbi:MAG TPA: phosphate ABC transporter permease PstA [Fimbriimonadaceae bacterium]|nr:phosphate ABC transporter permease PstA [Fimbriimonadaceae bacterium]